RKLSAWTKRPKRTNLSALGRSSAKLATRDDLRMIGIGSTVGNYRVVKKLGSGAMGSVFLAEHPFIGKRVALKVIHSDLAENEEMVSRFFNEARAVTRIGHQNIVEVIDFGQTPEGDNFIVMELLEGVSLGD